MISQIVKRVATTENEHHNKFQKALRTDQGITARTAVAAEANESQHLCPTREQDSCTRIAKTIEFAEDENQSQRIAKATELTEGEDEIQRLPKTTELIEDRQTSGNKQREGSGKGSRRRNKIDESEKKTYSMKRRPVSGSEEPVHDVNVVFRTVNLIETNSHNVQPYRYYVTDNHPSFHLTWRMELCLHPSYRFY